MLRKPRFKASFHVEPVDPDHLFLLTEDKQWIMTGRAYRQLAPLLDGEHTLADMTMKLEGTLFLPEIYRVLGQFEAAGFLVEGEEESPSPVAAFWHSLGVTETTARQRLAEMPVSVMALGKAPVTPLVAALERQGVQVVENGAFTVVIADDYLNEELAAINEQALATGRPWMLARLTGHSPWVGPIFRPGQSACWACMAERIRTNRQVEGYILRRSGRTGPLQMAVSALPSTIEIGANLAAVEILKWIGKGANARLEGRLVTYNSTGSEAQSHAVVRRPQCPTCGEPQRYREISPVILRNSPKKFTGDGGHRTLMPEETFARYEHHISPITGVVNWLVNITGEVNGLTYSYIAGHNFAMGPDNVYWLLKSLRSRTGGKGMTEIQAKVSAIGEAIERYSGVWRGDEGSIRGSYRDLGEQAIDLRDCLLFSEGQYANRDAWNAERHGVHFHVVPAPFDESQEMEWTPLWSLTQEEVRYLPTAYCYYGHPESQSHFFCTADSNGCSAGNTREEAILQGFLELVERDAVAIWWYNRVRRPAVDLDSFDLPYLQTLRSYYEQLHRDLWVLDITSDLGIPAFAAISRRTDRDIEDITLGFAAHLDPKIAMLRAITELNQFLPAVTAMAPDGSTLYNFPDTEAVQWWKSATVAEHGYLVPDRECSPRRMRDYPRLYGDDLMDDVHTCMEIVRGAGLEMLVLDQTRPDIGMPVCRVVVPGLRHFWRRLGLGRLFDVPVRLGWLDHPTPEESLNPYSIFF